MSETAIPFHYVCTHEEAGQLIEVRNRFWVSNCGCRESRGHCDRSRIDVCLWFYNDIQIFGSGLHEASRSEVHGILKEAEAKHLVSRPFRHERDMTKTAGICFCCDDCCEYFAKPDQKCDKGAHLESTDMDSCTQCGICEDVCHFGARKMVEGKLVIDQNECYGCGLCRDLCPEECIQMLARN